MYLTHENAKKEDKRDTVAAGKRKNVDSNYDEKYEVKKIKMKKRESSKAEGSKAYVFLTQTSPKMLFNALQTLRPVQKACLEQMGFEGLGCGHVC